MYIDSLTLRDCLGLSFHKGYTFILPSVFFIFHLISKNQELLGSSHMYHTAHVPNFHFLTGCRKFKKKLRVVIESSKLHLQLAWLSSILH